MKRTTIHALTVVLCGAVLAGCSSAVPTDTPGVDQLGQFVARQEGPQLDVVLGYRYAAQNPGAEWLMLEVACSAPNRSEARVVRDNIFVKTPAGVRVPLATQAEFGSEFNDLRAKVRKADIARDPMDYFSARRQPCALRFFTEPGRGVVHDEVSVNDRRACAGRLYFKIPGGTQTGRWVFGIDLEESTVRIPFRL